MSGAPTPLLGWLGTYAYDTSKGRSERIAAYLGAGVPVVLDSGAFTAWRQGVTIDRDEHGAWVDGWVKRAEDLPGLLFPYALDAIGDPDRSFRNWRWARDRGLPVVPTLHYGEDPSLVSRYLGEADWIGVGGMVPHLPGKGWKNVAAWCAAILKQTRAAGVKVHALGAVHPHLHDLLPFDSCDSTYWLSGSIHGVHALFDPDRGRWVKLKTDTRKAYRHGRMIREHYPDFGPELVDATTRGKDGRKLSEQIAIRSHELFARHYRRRWGSDLIVFLAGGDPDVKVIV